MQMEFAGAVSVRNFVVVNFTEPIVGSYCAAVGKNKSAHGIGDGGILLNAPIGDVQVFVNRVTIVEKSVFHVAQLFALASIENICLCDICIAGLNENGLNTVLNVFDIHKFILNFG